MKKKLYMRGNAENQILTPFTLLKTRSNFAEIYEHLSQSMQAAFGAELKFDFQTSDNKSDRNLDCPH